jgi:asparaginyl-tRNA synthetase
MRQQKNVTFLQLNDGSCLSNIQVVIDNVSKEESQKFQVGCSLEVNGEIVESIGSKQPTEVLVKSLEMVKIIGESSELYPLQKKRHTNEYLREIAHLRPRSNQNGAVLRIRNKSMMYIHQFFQDNGFYNIHTPIISGIDCEGAGEQFNVVASKDPNFFGSNAYLTVSGQLEAEIFANSLGNVYTFGPTFRAESGKSPRHLSEFWMVEMEKAFCDLNENMKYIESMLKYVVKNVLENCQEDIHFFNQYVDETLLTRLDSLINDPFVVLSYTQVIEILKESKKKFEFPVYWGCDLHSEHENFICKEYTKKPTFVINYPKDLKPFYAKVNEDGKTVQAVDLLISGIGFISHHL